MVARRWEAGQLSPQPCCSQPPHESQPNSRERRLVMVWLGLEQKEARGPLLLGVLSKNNGLPQGARVWQVGGGGAERVAGGGCE